MFIAMSQFQVANNMIGEIKLAFKNRAGLVDQAEGFQRMDVLSPLEQPDEIWLMTYWSDEASYRAWHHSHHYKEAHQGIPKGLKLKPGKTKLLFLEHVTS